MLVLFLPFSSPSLPGITKDWEARQRPPLFSFRWRFNIHFPEAALSKKAVFSLPLSDLFLPCLAPILSVEIAPSENNPPNVPFLLSLLFVFLFEELPSSSFWAFSRLSFLLPPPSRMSLMQLFFIFHSFFSERLTWIFTSETNNEWSFSPPILFFVLINSRFPLASIRLTPIPYPNLALLFPLSYVSQFPIPFPVIRGNISLANSSTP